MRDPRALAAMPDGDLEAALRSLGRELAWPAYEASPAAVDVAQRVRLRIERDRTARTSRSWMPWSSAAIRRPVRRALVLALLAVVAIAALAAALTFGVPGIRFTPAPTPSPAAPGSVASPRAITSPPLARSPLPTVAGPPGTGLGLGVPVAPADAPKAVDFPLILPPPDQVGNPVTAWLLSGRLSLVWPSGSDLPPMDEPGVGLILTEFRGTIDEGYFEKVISQGTTIAPVSVGSADGFWITGARHEIILVDPSGEPVFDSRRSVGDTLIWARGDVTYRLETALDRASAIALAETLR